MKKLLYQLLAVGVLASFLAGCSQVTPEAPKPAPTPAVSANFSFDYFSAPEYLSYATAQGDGNYIAPLVLGRSQITGGHPLYIFRPTKDSNPSNPYGLPGSWANIPGPNNQGLVKVVAQKNLDSRLSIYYRNFYGIDDQKTLWFAREIPDQDVNKDVPGAKISASSWQNTGVKASDVTMQLLSYSNGATEEVVVFLDNNPVPGGYSIYRISSPGLQNNQGAFATSQISPGAAGVQVAVDGRARVWVTTSNNQIWVGSNLNATGTFQKIDGAGVGIAIGTFASSIGLLGAAYGSTGYEIFSRSIYDPITSYTWTQQTGQLVQMSAIGNSNKFIGVSSDGLLWISQ